MMLRTIRVYGRLAKFLKRRKFEAQVASAAEAVRFLLANFPKLEPELVKGHYHVSVGNYSLSESELHDPAGQQEIKIIPVLTGAGSATANIIAGVALIAAAVIIPGLAAGAILSGSLSYGVGSAIGTAAILGGYAGAALVLGGIAQLLTPTVTTDATDTDPTETFSFNGVQQTSREGVPVPIVYGEILVGSVVISAAVDTQTV